MKFYVDDITKTVQILSMGNIGNVDINLMVYHPDLKIWQNLLVNFGVFGISQKK